MPKLLVLFFGAEGPASTLADFAADGASEVRFTEVDVRAGAEHQLTAGTRRKVLEAPARVGDYDGVVIAAPSSGDTPAPLHDLLAHLEEHAPRDAFANTVFAVIGGESTAVLPHVARLGGIIVSESRGISDPEARARATGARAAKVVAWVRHALSQEQGNHQGHDHSHSHEAGSGHGHDHHH